MRHQNVSTDYKFLLLAGTRPLLQCADTRQRFLPRVGGERRVKRGKTLYRRTYISKTRHRRYKYFIRLW